MPIKRTNYTSSKHWDRMDSYSNAYRLVAALSILGFIGITVRYTYMWFNSVERYNAQLHVVDTLAAQSPDGRQAVATNLLWLHSQGLAPDALDDSTFRWMLGAVERTGSGGWTTTDPLSWSPFIHSWVLAWIACTAVACSLMLGLVYYWDCKDRHHYLADLPWSKPWVWWFVLWAPVLWLPFVISGVRMVIKPPQQRTTRPRSKRQRSFIPDTAGAKVIYWQMRQRGTATGHQFYKEKVNGDLEDVRGLCTQLAEELQEAQRKQLRLKAESARIHDIAEPDPPTDDLLEKEFERLRQLPGVEGMRPVSDTTIALMVAATFEYQGNRYDLGGWDLHLDLTGTVKAIELRSGVLASWSGGAPVYRMGKKFCFGQHEKLIITHLVQGQILEAAALAVQGLHTVNSEHVHRVPRAFVQIAEESV